jgi:pyridoxal phosphate enzyme (YggS family)
VEANLRRIRECIARAAEAARRDPDEVTLIAVTKTHAADAIEMAYEAGIRHFGENRVQEWEEKRPHVANLEATWHLIGHLQSNKLKRALDIFDRIDSVDSLELAQKLDKARAGKAKLPILLEVRTDLVSAKTGLHPDDLQTVAESVLSLANLELRGLMTIPPPFPANDQARPYFRYLREMRDALERRFQSKFPVISMGMSNDFEAAVAEGATEVRLGTALFGERPHPL